MPVVDDDVSSPPVLLFDGNHVDDATFAHLAKWLRWAATLQTTVGITLLGLLGFCLENRLRNA